MALMMMIMSVDDDLLTVDSFGEDPNANIHSQIMSLCFLVDLAGIPEVPTRDELNPNRAPFYLTTSNNHHYQMRFSTIQLLLLHQTKAGRLGLISKCSCMQVGH